MRSVVTANPKKTRQTVMSVRTTEKKQRYLTTNKDHSFAQHVVFLLIMAILSLLSRVYHLRLHSFNFIHHHSSSLSFFVLLLFALTILSLHLCFFLLLLLLIVVFVVVVVVTIIMCRNGDCPLLTRKKRKCTLTTMGQKNCIHCIYVIYIFLALLLKVGMVLFWSPHTYMYFFFQSICAET